MTQETLTTQAQALAACLGDEWTASGYNERSFRLKRLDGLGLFVRHDHSRFEISGDWGNLYNFLPYRDYEKRQRWGKITVGATRSPECIAKEINRRKLPVLIPAWEKATAAFEQSISSERTLRVLTRKLADILGETRLDSNGEYFTHYGLDRLWVKCHPQYTGDAVNLELHGVKPEQAEAILCLLAAEA